MCGVEERIPFAADHIALSHLKTQQKYLGNYPTWRLHEWGDVATNMRDLPGQVEFLR